MKLNILIKWLHGILTKPLTILKAYIIILRINIKIQQIRDQIYVIDVIINQILTSVVYVIYVDVCQIIKLELKMNFVNKVNGNYCHKLNVNDYGFQK